MEPNIRSMLDTLTIHWSTKCSMEITVNRIDGKVVVGHVQTINMDSSCENAAGQTDHWEPLSSAGPLCGGIMKNELTFCLSTQRQTQGKAP